MGYEDQLRQAERVLDKLISSSAANRARFFEDPAGLLMGRLVTLLDEAC